MRDALTGAATSACMRCQAQTPLDLHADHAMACGARRIHATQRHDDVRDTIYGFAREHLPSARCKHEPSAAYLMSSDYTAEECALLFPSDSNVATKKMSLSLLELIDARNCSMPSQVNAKSLAVNAAMAALASHIVGRRNRQPGSQWKVRIAGQGGIRPDILFRVPGSSPPIEDWLDISVGHGTAGARRARAMRELRKAQETSVSHPSVVIRQVEAQKLRHYKPMVDAATSRFERGSRLAAPTFVPFVLSCRGEMGPLATAFIDKLRSLIISSAPSGRPRDCVPPVKRANKAKRKLLLGVHTCSAIGTGRILASALGHSWSGRQ